MTAFLHDEGLSQGEVVAAIEDRFALVGYARYLKALELIAGSGEARSVSLSWDAWAAALAGAPEHLVEFLAFCHERGALVVADDGECVTVGCPGLALATTRDAVAPPPAPDTLYTTPEQWADWFARELSMPESIASQPTHQHYFRRWCATNVTVGEMNAAVAAAIEAGEGLATSALHRHLQVQRQQRIKEAREW